MAVAQEWVLEKAEALEMAGQARVEAVAAKPEVVRVVALVVAAPQCHEEIQVGKGTGEEAHRVVVVA